MSQIKPAMTAEEWAEVEGVVFRIIEDAPSVFEAFVDSASDVHAAAAELLHGQPFGFTWADVDLLRSAADEAQDSARPLTPEGQAEARAPFDSLADRHRGAAAAEGIMSEESEDLERYFRSVEEIADHTLRIGRVLRAAYPSMSELHFAMTGRRLPSDDPLEDEFREMESAATEDD